MNKTLLLLATIVLTCAKPVSAQTVKDFRSYGGLKYENLAGIVSDSLGNNVIFGTYEGTLNAGNNIVLQSQKGADDFFLIKRDSTGQTIWARSFGSNDTIVNHAWYKDGAADLSIDKDGNIYVLGEVNCSADLIFDTITVPDAQTPTAKNVFVSMFDKNGHCKWLRVNSTNPNAGPEKIVVDAKKRCSITGGAYGGEVFGTYTVSGSGSYIAMLDSTGTPLWAKSYMANINALATDENGYVYCTGITASGQFGPVALTPKGNMDLVNAKIDSVGNVIWAKSEGAAGITMNAFAIERSNNQLYVLASTNNPLVLGTSTLNINNKFFLSTFDLQGTIQSAWPTEIGSNWGDGGNSDIHFNKKGELFVLLYSSATFSFGNSYIFAPNVASMILKYTPSGLPDWGISYASSLAYNSFSRKIGSDNYNHLFVGGSFSGNMAIAGSATMSTPGPNNWDGFAAILGSRNITAGLKEIYNSYSFEMFPNPATDVLNLDSQELLGHEYSITNQLGQIVATGKLTAPSDARVDVSTLNNGVYFMNLLNKNGSRASGKFLIAR